MMTTGDWPPGEETQVRICEEIGRGRGVDEKKNIVVDEKKNIVVSMTHEFFRCFLRTLTTNRKKSQKRNH
jgi:hypothetical protein